MRSFRTYISESRNLHLEHIEDLVLDHGVAGAMDALDFLRGIASMLNGNSTSSYKITTKWDGAPAIFAGINPENGRFFVATKGLFNKNAKLNYTPSDIHTNYSGGLAQKLLVALENLEKLGIKGILQGDIMFTQEDLKEIKIRNEMYVTFQPNTILYAVPSDTDLAREIKRAKIGVVFHTAYTGNTIADLKASFNPNIKSLRKTPDVWYQDADYRDLSGTATFTGTESVKLARNLVDIERSIIKSQSFLTDLAKDKELVALLKQYINANIRGGIIHGDADGFSDWLGSYSEKQSSSLKTDAAKNRKAAYFQQIADRVRKNKKAVNEVFDLRRSITQAKNMIVDKLSQVEGIGTFLKTGNGYKVTTPEGFVAVDHLSNNAVKLVDRLGFSQANFNAVKSWT